MLSALGTRWVPCEDVYAGLPRCSLNFEPQWNGSAHFLWAGVASVKARKLLEKQPPCIGRLLYTGTAETEIEMPLFHKSEPAGRDLRVSVWGGLALQGWSLHRFAASALGGRSRGGGGGVN